MAKSGSDPSLDPILELLKDVKNETRETKKSVDSMNRELGGVQVTLKNIVEDNRKQDKQIADVAKAQSGCPARIGHDGVNARLKRMDCKLDEGDTGSFNIPMNPGFHAAMMPNSSDIPWKEAFVKMLPLFIFAFVAGVGAFAILWWKNFGGG